MQVTIQCRPRCKRLLARLLLLVPLIALPACESLGYYKQAVVGHLSLLHQARPIEQLLSKPQLADSELANKLGLVQQLRAFARDELGLPVGRAYSRYVELERDYVVWNVFASEEFSVQPKRWCFPIAGCVAYRGYFSLAQAQKKAAALKREGFDTHVGGAAAYSTLGWTADPVLSTFVQRDEVTLASLLFHELSHRLVYVKGDTEFNESLASTIETYGLERWLAQRSDTEDVQALRQQLVQRQQKKAIQRAFTDAVAKTREALGELYQRPLNDTDKRIGKLIILDSLRKRVHVIAHATAWASAYQKWAVDLNNAKLAPVALYARWQNALGWQLAQKLEYAGCTQLPEKLERDRLRCRQGLEQFFEAARQLARLGEQARLERLQEWDLRASAS